MVARRLVQGAITSMLLCSFLLVRTRDKLHRHRH